MKHAIVTTTLLALALTAVGCKPDAKDADVILANLDDYVGQRVVMKASFRAGARCRIGDEDGEWKTFCGSKNDCQYCRGPLVVNAGDKEADLDDWPMILGGTHEGKPIKCQGPLNEVKCFPFEPGKTYIVRGLIEAHHPPRLMVSDFWDADD